jgi:hypothetical protein
LDKDKEKLWPTGMMVTEFGLLSAIVISLPLIETTADLKLLGLSGNDPANADVMPPALKPKEDGKAILQLSNNPICKSGLEYSILTFPDCPKPVSDSMTLDVLAPSHAR